MFLETQVQVDKESVSSQSFGSVSDQVGAGAAAEPLHWKQQLDTASRPLRRVNKDNRGSGLT